MISKKKSEVPFLVGPLALAIALACSSGAHEDSMGHQSSADSGPETSTDDPRRAQCASNPECAPFGLHCDAAKGYCVSCVAHADCKREQFCDDGECVPDVCYAYQRSCTGNA